MPILATWWEELTIGKDLDAGKDWGQDEEAATEDEMVGWHHRLNGQEFEQTPGDGEGQRNLACCSPWGHKGSDMTEWLKNATRESIPLASPSFQTCTGYTADVQKEQEHNHVTVLLRALHPNQDNNLEPRGPYPTKQKPRNRHWTKEITSAKHWRGTKSTLVWVSDWNIGLYS